MIGALLQGKPDKEKIGMLKALPVPPPAKIILGMMHLSAEADAFKLLKRRSLRRSATTRRTNVPTALNSK